MAAHYQIIVTNGFSRSLMKLISKHPEVLEVYEKALDALEVDPGNLMRTRDIKKLSDVSVGDGQWRIRVRQYRLRYDIEGEIVVLRSINDRKDAYR